MTPEEAASETRWLYHVVLEERWARTGDPYAPSSLGDEGFIHASYRDATLESARLYFPEGSARVVLRIDPRFLGERVAETTTPRGPMPHVHGAIPRHAIVEVTPLESFAPDGLPDWIA